MKRIGPRTLPWGTPLVMIFESEKKFPTFTCCDLPKSIDFIQDSTLPVIPEFWSLWTSFGNETESNARAKSICATKMSFFEFIWSVQSFRHSKMLRQVECFARNPCWLGDKSFFSSKNGTRIVFIADSKILLPAQVSEIGL